MEETRSIYYRKCEVLGCLNTVNTHILFKPHDDEGNPNRSNLWVTKVDASFRKRKNFQGFNNFMICLIHFLTGK